MQFLVSNLDFAGAKCPSRRLKINCAIESLISAALPMTKDLTQPPRLRVLVTSIPKSGFRTLGILSRSAKHPAASDWQGSAPAGSRPSAMAIEWALPANLTLLGASLTSKASPIPKLTKSSFCSGYCGNQKSQEVSDSGLRGAKFFEMLED